MRKIVAILLVFCVIARGESEILEVSALHFNADENGGVIELRENVAIKKGKDELYAPKVVIEIDKNRKPRKYSAFGGVDFAVSTQDGRLLKGSAKEVHYDAIKGDYHLKGSAKVRENNKVNSVVGEEIIINNETGFLNITGTKSKPAKIIFQMESKSDKGN